MTGLTRRYAYLLTCPDCRHPIALTGILTPTPARNGMQDLIIDNDLLQQAVNIHLNHCGDTP